MKRFVVCFPAPIRTVYHVDANTRFQALLKACRKRRMYEWTKNAPLQYEYIVYTGGEIWEQKATVHN